MSSLKRALGELLVFYLLLNLAYFLLLFLSGLSLKERILLVSLAALFLSIFLSKKLL